MQTLEFWKAITMDSSSVLEDFIAMLEHAQLRYCLIDGQAVNAYVAPLVSLDLDLVVAATDLERLASLLPVGATLQRFPHSLNLELAGSALRIQFQTDACYFSFVERASRREVLGMQLPVASLTDLLQGKIWAAQDGTRRASKRQKDLADIARIIEAYPELRVLVPDDVLSRLVV
ncbi:MAG: hypothetical protein EI684_19325 [Candidatus Viridilinea halotolerans]|uniref:Uncharacterized protein n=1 Tax=Candidatus Viridilinea halotolerans TaxID=2491704 RepID=A0A426TSS8_9CHLR|nr:MAG: hypothetical protein EI684_19325 [Candidatus Viridilinea halotolerans]